MAQREGKGKVKIKFKYVYLASFVYVCFKEGQFSLLAQKKPFRNKSSIVKIISHIGNPRGLLPSVLSLLYIIDEVMNQWSGPYMQKGRRLHAMTTSSLNGHTSGNMQIRNENQGSGHGGGHGHHLPQHHHHRHPLLPPPAGPAPGANLSLAEIARTYPDLTEDERDILVNIRRRKMELMHEIRYSWCLLFWRYRIVSLMYFTPYLQSVKRRTQWCECRYWGYGHRGGRQGQELADGQKEV